MKKELEELDKTTDLLKEFKSRINEEDETTDIDSLMEEWKSNNKIKNKSHKEKEMSLVDLEDKTLELSDLEEDRTVKLDYINNYIKLDEKSIEEKLNEGIDKRKKQKKYGLILICFSLFFVPLMIFLFMINSHSNKLINKDILVLLSGLLIGLLIVGLNFYLRNISLSDDIVGKNILFKLYVYFMVSYSVIVTIVLILFYGPAIEFKEMFVEYCSKTGKDIHTFIYSEEEIQSIKNKEN